MESQLSDLPENVRRGLTDFVHVAREALGSNLSSIVLFGSATEGRLRATSELLEVLARTVTLPLTVIIERDGSYPAFQSLLDQVCQARRILRKARKTQAVPRSNHECARI